MSFVQKKLDDLFIKDRRRYEYYMDLVSDLFYAQIERGIDSKAGIRKKAYPGFLKLVYRAADKITIDRYESSYNFSLKVDLLHLSDDEYHLNEIYRMYYECLEVNNPNPNVSTKELFLEYLLYALGDKDYLNLNTNITDEMLKFWYDTFKIPYLLFYPTNIFTKDLEMDFSTIHNINKFEAYNIIDNSVKDYIDYLCAKVECKIYSPYINL